MRENPLQQNGHFDRLSPENRRTAPETETLAGFVVFARQRITHQEALTAQTGSVIRQYGDGPR